MIIPKRSARILIQVCKTLMWLQWIIYPDNDQSFVKARRIPEEITCYECYRPAAFFDFSVSDPPNPRPHTAPEEPILEKIYQ